MDATSVVQASGSTGCSSAERTSGDEREHLRDVPRAVSAGANDVTCVRCTGHFVCRASAASCWCQSLPSLNLSSLPAELRARGCLCPACLRAAVTAQALA